jgi:hypothetical protein
MELGGGFLGEDDGFLFINNCDMQTELRTRRVAVNHFRTNLKGMGRKKF